jgi:hypothetical protein
MGTFPTGSPVIPLPLHRSGAAARLAGTAPTGRGLPKPCTTASIRRYPLPPGRTSADPHGFVPSRPRRTALPPMPNPVARSFNIRQLTDVSDCNLQHHF